MVVSANQKGELAKRVKMAHLCPKCKTPFDARLHRNFFVKTFLFWLPLRRYACYTCNRKYYVWR